MTAPAEPAAALPPPAATTANVVCEACSPCCPAPVGGVVDAVGPVSTVDGVYAPAAVAVMVLLCAGVTTVNEGCAEKSKGWKELTLGLSRDPGVRALRRADCLYDKTEESTQVSKSRWGKPRTQKRPECLR